MFAHYRVVEQIGEGGMGQVWKAVDTTLDREVAIKVLPEGFHLDAERLARFQREAKLLAGLNHPNIATVHGLHEAEGVRFLVMELIAGADLSKDVARGRVPIERVVDVGRQVAEALEAAHESGIVHRDLKPANIIVTPEGQVKVLDFGLAKSAGEAGDPDISTSPTLTSAGTQAGMILGTAAYLSPEQAKGQAVDRRTDIWAFGVVLHELLSGQRTFRGEGLSETLAAVILTEPDLESLPPDTPPRVRELVRRCLIKDPRKRLRDIGEARVVLEEPGAEIATPEPVSQPAAEAPRRRWVPMALAAIPIAAVAAFLAGRALSPGAPVPTPVRLKAEISADEVFPNRPGMPLVLSPDGTTMAYTLGQPAVIRVRSLEHLEDTPLAGTENAQQPFFSPDGRWIGFFANGKLKKVSVSGGAPLTLADANIPRGADWGPDDTIVYVPVTTSGLLRISAAGGEPESLTTLEREEGTTDRSHRWTRFATDGRSVLFVEQDPGSSFSSGTIMRLDLDSGEETEVHRGGTHPMTAPGGFLVFARDGTLFAARLDSRDGSAIGSPVPVLEGVVTSNGNGGAGVAFSRTGTLAFLSGGVGTPWTGRIGRLLPDGPFEAFGIEPAKASDAAVSPDGRLVAYQLLDPSESSSNIWVHDIERDVSTRLTFVEAWEWQPSWSPDGQYVLFSSNRAGSMALFRKRADGSGDAEVISRTDKLAWGGGSMSPDGRHLAFHAAGTGDADILVQDLGDDSEATPFVTAELNQRYPAFSPDGRWIAYDSAESGQSEVYVRPFPGPGGRWQISRGGGEHPSWSHDGRTLYFEVGSATISAVDVQVEGESIRAGRQREVVTAEHTIRGRWSVLEDGSFVVTQMVAPDEGTIDRATVTMVFDWPTELERLVP
jgi:serine/threonine-protein kinase